MFALPQIGRASPWRTVTLTIAIMKPITPETMHQLVMTAFRQRRDTGLRNAFAYALLEPVNPFQPKQTRRVPRSVGAVLSLVGVMLAGFIYFSFRF